VSRKIVAQAECGLAQDYEPWIGQTQTATDTVTAAMARRMGVTLSSRLSPGDGDALPPLWHWMGWAPDAPHADLGPDGHLKRGGFLPAIALPRRMWAGGRVQWQGALRVGEVLTRVTTILSIADKQGATGAMTLVTLGHRISGATGVVEEEQDLVFVALPDRWTPPAAKPAPPDPDHTETVDIDPVRLFRFSALTFNGHRIHYDAPYATGVEHYPGLVVHGPLQAMLLVDRLHQPPATLRYRGVHPAFAGALSLCRWGDRLATVAPQGHQCMTAEVTR
jgi:3-methylfumaryl-CoA hydratase